MKENRTENSRMHTVWDEAKSYFIKPVHKCVKYKHTHAHIEKCIYR